jgi:hypothetical protein
VTLPEVGLSSPMTCLTNVVLPAPLGPTKHYTSPGLIWMEMPSLATAPRRYVLCRSSIVNGQTVHVAPSPEVTSTPLC